MDGKGYTQDGSVDLKGRPVLAAQTGKWKACAFLVGNIYNLLSTHLSTNLYKLGEKLLIKLRLLNFHAWIIIRCILYSLSLKILRVSIILRSLSIKFSCIPFERNNYDFLFIKNFIEIVLLMQYGTASCQWNIKELRCDVYKFISLLFKQTNKQRIS